LPSASDISREAALALIESCRQGIAPVQRALVLAVGREDLISCMKHDLTHVASHGSCLRVINGVFGIGKTFTLRVLQEYAHTEGFATSFLTLSSRECPMDDLTAIYRHVVRGIRVADCLDRPALEHLLEAWAKEVKEYMVQHRLVPRGLSKLDTSFKVALTQYYEGVHFGRPEKADLALRWLRGETTMIDAKRLGTNYTISSVNALIMLGNLTRMLRFIGIKGLVILLDEVDAIPSLSSAAKKEAAYTNLLSLACATSNTPYSYFVYVTTPAFFEEVPLGFDDALKNVITLGQLTSTTLAELAEKIRDLHFQAYGWQRGDLGTSSIKRFVHTCISSSIETPRAFVRTLVAALDICEENKGLTLDKVVRALS